MEILTTSNRRKHFGKFKIPFIFLTVVVSFYCGYESHTQVYRSNMVTITAEHLGYQESYGKLVYTNTDKDIAVYVDESYKPDEATVGNTVIVDAISEGKVVSSSNGGFCVEMKYSSDIHYGLSGTAVTDLNGNAIGFVSRLEGESKLYCVYY